jgi:hypothetical protein
MKMSVGVDVQLHNSWPRHWMEIGGQMHVPAALNTGKQPLRYPMDRRLRGPHSRSGPCGGEIYCPCQESNPGGPTPRPSLCWLSYPGYTRLLSVYKSWDALMMQCLVTAAGTWVRYMSIQLNYEAILRISQYCTRHSSSVLNQIRLPVPFSLL